MRKAPPPPVSPPVRGAEPPSVSSAGGGPTVIADYAADSRCSHIVMAVGDSGGFADVFHRRTPLKLLNAAGLPLTWGVSQFNGQAKWVWKTWVEPRPLYLPAGQLLAGRPVVVTFAYAHCTTICPVIVSEVLGARDKLALHKPVVLIVTLDPWRDTPARAVIDDLSETEFGILEALYHKGPLLLGDVQKKILLSSGGVTYAVDRLAEKGLVERRECSSDRRARYAARHGSGRRDRDGRADAGRRRRGGDGRGKREGRRRRAGAALRRWAGGRGRRGGGLA